MNAATLHPFAAYWDRGVRNVPDMTGAKHLLDCRDLAAVFASLEMPARLPNVLDVGCGTGRLASLCDGYTGVDISPSMVDYCQQAGLRVALIAGAEDLTESSIAGFDWITAISVCTHIDRPERQAYLAAFARSSGQVLIDIIPGDGAGDVALWTADLDEFEADIEAAGFAIVGVVNHQWDAHTHRYYRLRRAA